jgi:hypothetical protein
MVPEWLVLLGIEKLHRGGLETTMVIDCAPGCLDCFTPLVLLRAHISRS